jgi:hypothetical protein
MRQCWLRKAAMGKFRVSVAPITVELIGGMVFTKMGSSVAFE